MDLSCFIILHIIGKNSTWRIYYRFLYEIMINFFFFINLLIMSPTKGEVGHISFSADPGRRRRRDSWVSTISLESMGGILPDLHEYIIGTSQRAD